MSVKKRVFVPPPFSLVNLNLLFLLLRNLFILRLAFLMGCLLEFEFGNQLVDVDATVFLILGQRHVLGLKLSHGTQDVLHLAVAVCSLLLLIECFGAPVKSDRMWSS